MFFSKSFALTAVALVASTGVSASVMLEARQDCYTRTRTITEYRPAMTSTSTVTSTITETSSETFSKRQTPYTTTETSPFATFTESTPKTMGDLVQPLLQWPTLERAVVNATRSEYQVTEGDIERMARAWPKLTRLALRWNARASRAAGGAVPPLKI
ncbi:hypothetical protein L226DRAFT_573310 [Lentinus tigrinus ALCF2SS1-7]|uniref:Uncharacterized protein n=1 Tax=Lentinus tigrinus ALCF2SS1-6 TaxID=1328759 RepID=A0A5C2S3I7_9APHY|nr:hypothetical protein L227DRAFT_655057 [Lentinus tigrinus ALCF2SS1-6]RPD72256.1 hypothetical protein L226DRAFT_573310 [Lentinus tigrinus ALCF2SS1-7]